MGYYTKFELKIEDGHDTSINNVLTYAKENKLNFAMVFNYSNYSDEQKWYYHEEEMKQISSVFPQIVFTLIGTGENEDDLWCKHFMGGKMQVCNAVITYDEYDPTKLE